MFGIKSEIQEIIEQNIKLKSNNEKLSDTLNEVKFMLSSTNNGCSHKDLPRLIIEDRVKYKKEFIEKLSNLSDIDLQISCDCVDPAIKDKIRLVINFLIKRIEPTSEDTLADKIACVVACTKPNGEMQQKIADILRFERIKKTGA